MQKKEDDKMKFSKELVSGSTPTLILAVIEKEDMYGYRISKELEQRSENAFSLKEGTMYPLLHALEKEKFVESYWKNVEGRKRKYYHITKKGKKHLCDRKKEFEQFSVSVKKGLNFAQ